MKAYKKEIMKEWWNKNPDYLPLGARWRGKWQKRQVKRIIREIDERTLDIQVQEKIFKNKVKIIEFPDYEDHDFCTEYPELAYTAFDMVPNYSTKIEDAWKIINYLSPDDTGYDLVVKQEINEGFAGTHVILNGSKVSIESSNVAEAICRAALQLVEHYEKP